MQRRDASATDKGKVMLTEVPTSDGTLTAGGYLPAVDGLVRNLWVRPAGLGAVAVSFDWEGLASDTVQVWVYINREAVGIARPGQVWVSVPLRGVSEILLVVVRASEAAPPVIYGEVGGDQFFLDWNPVTAADLEAYLVYWDAGSGTVSYTTPLATLTRVESARVLEALPSTGTGSGRVTVDGSYRGELVNGEFSIEVLSGSRWRYDVGGGWSDPLAIARGASVMIAPGLRAVFLDAAGDYDEGDAWTWEVGVVSRLMSEPQDSGTYKFTVKARDVAGNVGSASAEKSVVIVAGLEAPGSPAVAYDRDAETLTFTWAAPSDVRVETVGVFANYDGILGELVDYVQEEVPWVSAPSGDGELVVDVSGLPFGTWYFYLRSGDVGLAWERNATLLTMVTEDVQTGTLAAVVIEEAEAAAGGRMALAYAVDQGDGVPATINVYAGDSEDWDVLTLVESFAFVSESFPVSQGVHTTVATFVAAKWFGMRAATAGGVLGAKGNLVQGTPDATAPAAPTWGTAIAT